jgi:hypothetical protein
MPRPGIQENEVLIMSHKKKGSARLLEVVVVLDRSGSMDVIRQSTIAAFNGLLETQLRQTDARTTHLSLVLFNDEVNQVWSSVPLPEVEKLSCRMYEPRGNTAFYDALGITINTMDLRLSREDTPTASAATDREVLIAAISDGLENSSYRYRFPEIRDLIRRTITERHWDFLYLGPDELSRDWAIELGFPAENVEIFPVTDQGIHDSCRKISAAITRKKRVHSVAGWKGEDIR